MTTYRRTKAQLTIVMNVLRSIAKLPKNSLPRRLARSTVEFLDAMEAQRKRGKK